MIKKIAVIITIISQILQCADIGFSANRKLIHASAQTSANIAAITTTSGSTASTQTPTSSSNQSCPQAATPTNMPCLVIDLLDTAGTSINTYTFATSSSFATAANMILEIDIFPPSNIVSSSSVTPIAGATDDYAIVYSLKSLDGQMFQKYFQYNQQITPNPQSTACPTFIQQPATGSTTAAVNIISTKITANSFPTTVAIAVVPASQAAGASLTTSTQNTFLLFPSSATHTQKQQWFNNAAVIRQQFLVVNTSSTPSITPISGSYNSSGSTLTSQSPFASSTIAPTTGSALPAITINIADTSSNTQTVSFNNKSQTFNTADLAAGLIFQMFAYPATNGSGLATINDSFVLIGLLKTLDGLKFEKKVLQATVNGSSTTPITFSPAPCTLNINMNNNIVFATNFVNSSIGSSRANIISPLHCSCILQGSMSNVNVTQIS